MKYIVIDTCPELSCQPDTPVGWTVLGVAPLLDQAREIARNNAQEAWDGWEDKDNMPAERFFHPYLIASPVCVLHPTLLNRDTVRIEELDS
jgi:hypothetical protein